LEGTTFREILPDPFITDNQDGIERIVFCSGKVYYDLVQYRKEQEIGNTAIIRVEQLYPFHWELLEATIAPFKNASKFVWCQEEPLNMGAWSYIWPRLEKCVGSHHVRYSGRGRASSPAAGSKAMHLREQKMLVEEAFSV
jgi:2-oxoglutarate dehydrogenase E1 component